METVTQDTAGALQRDNFQHSRPIQRRTAIACVSCAATKTKCDRQYPCGRCLMKRLTCVSRQRRRGKFAGATTTSIAWTDPVPPEKSTGRNTTENEFSRHLPRLVGDGTLDGLPQMSPSHAVATSQTQATVLVGPVPSETNQRESGLGQNMMRPLDSGVDSRHLEATAVFPIDVVDSSHFGAETSAAGATGRPSTTAALNQSANLYFDDWETNLFSTIRSPVVFPSMPTNQPTGTPSAPWQPVINANTPQRDSVGPLQQDQSPSKLGIDENSAELIGEWQHWSICRCTPPPQHAAQDRAKSAIVTLDQNFWHPGPWSNIAEDWRYKNFAPSELFTNVSLSDISREWLLMIAQRFMRVAMDIHGLTLDSPSPASPDSDDFTSLGGYVRLPPSGALHNYLEIVLKNYEPFYPLIPARLLEPNQLADAKRGRGSSLLLFLMFAFGSMLDPAIKARRLSTALTEICRHSMHDVLEKDSGAPGSGLLFYGALMFTLKSCFSGDKAHMNIAIAHRHMYLTSMRSAALFKKQNAQRQSLPAEIESLKQAWQSWVERESVSRLAYGWVMLENEISLFYDCQPILNTSELEATLPADEKLWLASNVDEWRKALCEIASTDDWSIALQQQPEFSLRDLFQLLMDDQLDRSDYQPHLLHMRLLLYPLHVLVAQLGQLLDCGLDQFQSRGFSNPITQNSSIIRFGEIRSFLQAWYNAFEELTGQGARFRAVTNATLILYHIISLNLFTSFTKMEQLAREGYSSTDAELCEHLIRVPEDALVHCGQVLRLFNQMDDELQPIWSAAAIYRATITLWAFSISYSKSAHVQGGLGSKPGPLKDLVIDALPMRDLGVQHYLRCGEAKPHLTSKSGKVSMDDPKGILTLGKETLSRRCLTTSLSAGIRYKLEEMIRTWEEKHRSFGMRAPEKAMLAYNI